MKCTMIYKIWFILCEEDFHIFSQELSISTFSGPSIYRFYFQSSFLFHQHEWNISWEFDSVQPLSIYLSSLQSSKTYNIVSRLIMCHSCEWSDDIDYSLLSVELQVRWLWNHRIAPWSWDFLFHNTTGKLEHMIIFSQSGNLAWRLKM